MSYFGNISKMIHIRFTMELYKIQDAAGRYFLPCPSTPPRPAHGANRLLWVLLGLAAFRLLLEINASLVRLTKMAAPSRSPPSS